ncbi:hypothetical protein GQX73_g2645 [Xylaria multiplex]|uniref:Uncharacterized protein n=1 Tax=Xylaria multiplex TaxID=323545 RepID=A0A7C8N1N6_9PEZI|nr:hypothetical protein GQX73_g2645 [Xylaria multiplex]
MPATPRHSGPGSINSRSDWDQLCEITARRILRNGFEIEYLHAMTSVQIGAELGTGVVLVVAAGAKSVRHVKHTDPGVSEGLRDMANDGMSGRLLIYGLAFYFTPTGL